MYRKTRVSLHIFIIISILGGILFTTACASKSTGTPGKSDIPEQFLNPYINYPKEQYIVAVGTGDALEQSRQDALRALSQQIKVSVKSVGETQESFTSHVATSETSIVEDLALSNKTNVSTSGDFLGVQYGENFQDKQKKIYSIVYIHRITTGNIYRQRIEETSENVDLLVKKSSISQGLEKFSLLLNAVALSLQNDVAIEQLDVIAPPMAVLARNSREYTTPSLRNMLSNAASSIVFAIDITVDGSANTIDEIEKKIDFSMRQMLTSLQLSVGSSNAAYGVEINLLWQKQPDPKYASVSWQLSFNLKDDNDRTVISNVQNGISKGVDDFSAEKFAISDVQKSITSIFASYIKKHFSQL